MITTVGCRVDGEPTTVNVHISIVVGCYQTRFVGGERWAEAGRRVRGGQVEFEGGVCRGPGTAVDQRTSRAADQFSSVFSPSVLPRAEAMDTKPRQWKQRQDGVRSLLNTAVYDMGRAWFLAEKTLIIEVFSSAHEVLGMIRVRFPHFSGDIFQPT